MIKKRVFKGVLPSLSTQNIPFWVIIGIFRWIFFYCKNLFYLNSKKKLKIFYIK